MDFFYRWQDAVSHLAGLLERRRPIPGRNLSIEESPHGLIFNAELELLDDAAYYGYFKVLDVTDAESAKIQVIDGRCRQHWPANHAANRNAGYVTLGKRRLAVPQSAALAVTGTEMPGLVLLDVRFDADNVSFQYAIEQTLTGEDADNAAVMQPSADRERLVLGRFHFRQRHLILQQTQFGEIRLNRWG